MVMRAEIAENEHVCLCISQHGDLREGAARFRRRASHVSNGLLHRAIASCRRDVRAGAWLAGAGLASWMIAGCSATALGTTEIDGGRPRDAAIRADVWPESDATFADDGGIDADVFDARDFDAGSTERGCFDDVELVALSGGRESFEAHGVWAHEGGWVAAYSASSHGGLAERTAAFLDHEGRITARQALGWDDVVRESAVLGRFVLAWEYDRTRLYEIGDGELRDRTELLQPMVPGRIAAVDRESDRLRVLSSTRIDPTAGSFRFAYSEIVLGADGLLAVHTAELPPVETIGSPGLVDGLTRFHTIHSFSMHEDTFFFAFPAGGPLTATDNRPWNVVRVALDRSGLASGAVSWEVIDETRWEEGPIAVFGGLPDLDLAIAGRFVPSAAGTDYWPTIGAERFVGVAASPIALEPAGEGRLGSLGPVRMMRRGDVLALASTSRFRVFSLPTFALRASVPLELDNGLVFATWGEDAVIELGSVRSSAGVLGLARCHELGGL